MQPNRRPIFQRPQHEPSRNFVPYGTISTSDHNGPRTRSRSRELDNTNGPRTRSRSRELFDQQQQLRQAYRGRTRTPEPNNRFQPQQHINQGHYVHPRGQNFMPHENGIPQQSNSGPRARSRTRSRTPVQINSSYIQRQHRVYRDRSRTPGSNDQYQQPANQRSHPSRRNYQQGTPQSTSSIKQNGRQTRSRSRSRTPQQSNSSFYQQPQRPVYRNRIRTPEENFNSHNQSSGPSSSRRSEVPPRKSLLGKAPEHIYLDRSSNQQQQHHSCTYQTPSSSSSAATHNSSNRYSHNPLPASNNPSTSSHQAHENEDNFINPFCHINNPSTNTSQNTPENRSSHNAGDPEIITLSSDDENDDASTMNNDNPTLNNNSLTSPISMQSTTSTIGRQVCLAVSIVKLYDNEIFVPNIISNLKNKNGREAASFINATVRNYNTRKDRENRQR